MADAFQNAPAVKERQSLRARALAVAIASGDAFGRREKSTHLLHTTGCTHRLGLKKGSYDAWTVKTHNPYPT